MNKYAFDLITKFEGCKLRAYKCPAGVFTVGYGHTEGVYPDKLITMETAEQLLRQDLEKFEKGVRNLVKVPVVDYQLGALISFAFNVGLKAFEDSTLLKCLNRSEIQNAADEFLRWNKAAGKVLAGLTKRRQAERKVFLGEI